MLSASASFGAVAIPGLVSHTISSIGTEWLSVMIDESNAQQRRRDIRLELESLDPNDEIVREVLKKLS